MLKAELMNVVMLSVIMLNVMASFTVVKMSFQIVLFPEAVFIVMCDPSMNTL
jgi:hypothetical protein